MLTLGSHATDLLSRFTGSAHTRDNLSHGDKNTQAKEAQANLQDKDVLLTDKFQRVHRVLNVELSVNLSATFHRTSGPTSLSLYSEPKFDANAVSDNVMSFIKDRIDDGLAEGMSEEELADLLAQAEVGIAKGIAGAGDALESMRLLDGDVVQGVAEVEENLKQGIQDIKAYLLEQLDINDDVDVGVVKVAELASNQPISPSAFNQVNYYREQSSNVSQLFERFGPNELPQGVSSIERSGASLVTVDETFDFEVITKDGDVIRLSIGRGMSHESSYATVATGSGFGAAYNEQSYSYTNISYSVDGELDEGELAALDDLFSKVNKLADSFFSGNLDKAFKQAMRLDYDASELAGFALNLTQNLTMAETYQEIAHFAEPEVVESKQPTVVDFFQPIGQFVRDAVESMREVEERSPLDFVSDLVSELLGKAVSDNLNAEEDNLDTEENDQDELMTLGAYIQDFLSEIGRRHDM